MSLRTRIIAGAGLVPASFAVLLLIPDRWYLLALGGLVAFWLIVFAAIVIWCRRTAGPWSKEDEDLNREW